MMALNNASIMCLTSLLFSSRRRHTRFSRDWSSDVCSSDLASQRSVFKRNQYGGTIGGPIVKNKLFFFGSYEGTKARGSPGDVRYPTLTVAERSGDFSALLPKALTDPNAGTPFPGNIIPASRIRPYASTFVGTDLPLPNSGANFYDFTPVGTKLDQN